MPHCPRHKKFAPLASVTNPVTITLSHLIRAASLGLAGPHLQASSAICPVTPALPVAVTLCPEGEGG